MKTLKTFIISLFLFVAVLTPPIALEGCSSGSQLPPQVCEIGGTVCDITSYLCNNVPAIPPDVCTYLNLACVNLNLLCEETPGSTAYNEAVSSLKVINERLNDAVLSMKEKHKQEEQKTPE